VLYFAESAKVNTQSRVFIFGEPMNKKCKGTEGVIEYLLLATIIPLICVAIFVFIPAVNNSVFYLPLFGLQSIAPTLAAIIVVTHIYSARGLKAFLKEKYLSNISFSVCFLAFVIPLAVMLISKTIAVILQETDFAFILPNAKKILIIFWALIAEELGWRGYLQERIENRINIVFTPLIVGVIWGLWHFPYFLSGAMDVPFVLLILGCVFESYGYFVITKLAKGNIIPAGIWHFSGNLFINILGLNPVDNHGSKLPYFVMTLTYSICILCFLVYYRSQTKKRPEIG